MIRLEPAMTGKGIGPGEAASRAKSRRTILNFSVLALLGGAVGFTAALVEQHDAPISAGGTMPGWFAILAAAVMVVAVLGGSVFYHRNMDELQRLDNYWAATMGANVFLLGYPVWLILWKGGLVPAPDAMTLYLVVFVTMMIAYFWRKMR
ncbi:hypothetical protein [Sphingomonas psychrolutea]|uniref:Uncharacterized protein n=1 Tax=Sphingomonas psychrolutea TaxID=1259676 RepID=A0ABQ1GBS3_9SPHN|nr:hypothetical protein [Sphingomonas psychrolutea]GGA40623.1 hypothetical protein GCM10011395_08640 [Sphingomonas psychrolutea]